MVMICAIISIIHSHSFGFSYGSQAQPSGVPSARIWPPASLSTRKLWAKPRNAVQVFSSGTYHCPISFRYRLRASCQVGRGVKPFSTSLDLSRRLLQGRTALERPYSAVVTGTTVVVSPA